MSVSKATQPSDLTVNHFNSGLAVGFVKQGEFSTFFYSLDLVIFKQRLFDIKAPTQTHDSEGNLVTLVYDEKECSICMDAYDQDSKNFVVLPCFHTLCKPCYNDFSTYLIARGESMKCGKCKRVFQEVQDFIIVVDFE